MDDSLKVIIALTLFALLTQSLNWLLLVWVRRLKAENKRLQIAAGLLKVHAAKTESK